MNNIIRNLILFSVLMLGPVACKSLDYTHSQWVDDEEQIYIGKLDSLTVRSGMNKVEIVGKTNYIRTASTCKVEYGESLIKEFRLSDIIGDDNMARMLIDGLEGGTYYFKVTTHDDSGHRSIATTVAGTAYGDEDLMLLVPRKVKEMVPSYDGTMSVYWDQSEVSYLIVKYEKSDGTEATLKIEGNPEMTSLEDWKLGGKMSVQSFFVNSEDDLEALSLDPVEYTFLEKIEKMIPRLTEGSLIDFGPAADWNMEGAFTVEMKLRFTEFIYDYMSILASDYGGGGILFRNWGNYLHFVMFGDYMEANASSPIDLNRWYHIALTYEMDKVMQMYIDGELVAESPCGKLAKSSVHLQLGINPSNPANHYEGDVRDFSIWADVRTGEEIREDIDRVFTGQEDGLKAYWAMDERYDKLLDITGQHLATVSGVTWIPAE